MASANRILVYTTKTSGLPAGYCYSNPRWFSTPRSGFAKVIVDGDYPEIVVAYKKIGVPVAHSGMSKAEADAALEDEEPATETKQTEPERKTANDIDIPENYESLGWKEMRALAEQFSKEKIINKVQALKEIGDEIARRAAASATT
jgi:hypothetical protein